MPTDGGKEKLAGAIGLCRKAGRLLIGTEPVCEAVAAKKKPFGVFLAGDNAPNTDRRIRNKCSFYGVEIRQLPLSGADLAHAIGKSSHTAAVAVTDENLFRLVRGLTESDGV